MLLKNRTASPLRQSRQSTIKPQTSRSPMRTPTKTEPLQATKADSSILLKTPTSAKSLLKTKETMGILYSLEEIYLLLSFNDFDAFAQERITEARKNI